MNKIIFAGALVASMFAAAPTKEDYLRAQLKATTVGLKYQGLIIQLRAAETELGEVNKAVTDMTAELSKACKDTEVFNTSTIACELKPKEIKPSANSK